MHEVVDLRILTSYLLMNKRALIIQQQIFYVSRFGCDLYTKWNMRPTRGGEKRGEGTIEHSLTTPGLCAGQRLTKDWMDINERAPRGKIDKRSEFAKIQKPIVRPKSVKLS